MCKKELPENPEKPIKLIREPLKWKLIKIKKFVVLALAAFKNVSVSCLLSDEFLLL